MRIILNSREGRRCLRFQAAIRVFRGIKMKLILNEITKEDKEWNPKRMLPSRKKVARQKK